MKNYIVRNCPAILKTTLICNDFGGSLYTPRPCKDITDCVLKRIVDECKWETNIDIECRGDLAERILSELEIEEVYA